MISKLTSQSDMLGAMASGLCVVHCMATPFLFIAQSCSTTSSCCDSGPIWWSSIDHIFIGITFFAVYHSGKHTTAQWLKYAMYAIWVILSALILNEKFAFIPLSEMLKYTAAFGLIALHLYNLKYCQCADEACIAT